MRAYPYISSSFLANINMDLNLTLRLYLNFQFHFISKLFLFYRKKKNSFYILYSFSNLATFTRGAHLFTLIFRNNKTN